MLSAIFCLFLLSERGDASLLSVSSVGFAVAVFALLAISPNMNRLAQQIGPEESVDSDVLEKACRLASKAYAKLYPDQGIPRPKNFTVLEAAEGYGMGHVIASNGETSYPKHIIRLKMFRVLVGCPDGPREIYTTRYDWVAFTPTTPTEFAFVSQRQILPLEEQGDTA